MPDESPLVIDIPDAATIVTSPDGRMFIDMTYLYDSFNEVISGREFALTIIDGGTDFERGLICGQRSLIEDIRQNTETLSINASL